MAQCSARDLDHIDVKYADSARLQTNTANDLTTHQLTKKHIHPSTSHIHPPTSNDNSVLHNKLFSKHVHSCYTQVLFNPSLTFLYRPCHPPYPTMGSVVLPHLVTGWHVDQAIMSEEERLVIIRFGRDWDPDCMRQDEVLYRKKFLAPSMRPGLIWYFLGIADRVKNFAVIYVCDLDQVPDFKQMYGE